MRRPRRRGTELSPRHAEAQPPSRRSSITAPERSPSCSRTRRSSKRSRRLRRETRRPRSSSASRVIATVGCPGSRSRSSSTAVTCPRTGPRYAVRRLESSAYDHAGLLIRTLWHSPGEVIGPVLAHIDDVDTIDVAELISFRVTEGLEVVDLRPFPSARADDARRRRCRPVRGLRASRLRPRGIRAVAQDDDGLARPGGPVRDAMEPALRRSARAHHATTPRDRRRDHRGRHLGSAALRPARRRARGRQDSPRAGRPRSAPRDLERVRGDRLVGQRRRDVHRPARGPRRGDRDGPP